MFLGWNWLDLLIQKLSDFCDGLEVGGGTTKMENFEELRDVV